MAIPSKRFGLGLGLLLLGLAAALPEQRGQAARQRIAQVRQSAVRQQAGRVRQRAAAAARQRAVAAGRQRAAAAAKQRAQSQARQRAQAQSRARKRSNAGGRPSANRANGVRGANRGRTAAQALYGNRPGINPITNKPFKPKPGAASAARERLADLKANHQIPDAGHIRDRKKSGGASSSIDWERNRDRFKQWKDQKAGDLERRAKELASRSSGGSGESEGRQWGWSIGSEGWYEDEDDDRYQEDYDELPEDAEPLPGGSGILSDGKSFFVKKASGEGYRAAFPPVGTILDQVSAQAVEVSVGSETYYFDHGVFLSQVAKVDGKSFEVVPAPIGAIVRTLPAGSTKVTLGGRTYNEYAGVYYESVYSGGAFVHRVAQVAK